MRRRGRSVILSLSCALALVAPIAVAAPAGAAPQTWVPFWIPVTANCSTSQADLSPLLNQFFSDVAQVAAPGDTIQLLPDKCYRTESTIKIHDLRGGITFDGNGSRFRSFNDAQWVPKAQAHVK